MVEVWCCLLIAVLVYAVRCYVLLFVAWRFVFVIRCLSCVDFVCVVCWVFVWCLSFGLNVVVYLSVMCCYFFVVRCLSHGI